MVDDPIDTRARRMPGVEPESEGVADTPRDMATGALTLQDGSMDRPGTEAADTAPEPMTNEPVPVGEDSPGVGLSRPAEEMIDGSRGM